MQVGRQTDATKQLLRTIQRLWRLADLRLFDRTMAIICFSARLFPYFRAVLAKVFPCLTSSKFLCVTARLVPRSSGIVVLQMVIGPVSCTGFAIASGHRINVWTQVMTVDCPGRESFNFKSQFGTGLSVVFGDVPQMTKAHTAGLDHPIPGRP